MQALFQRKDPKNAKLIHVMSSGLKAGATWSRGEILQLCRECCGGQGFLSANKIGPMKNDMVRSRPAKLSTLLHGRRVLHPFDCIDACASSPH